MPNPPAGESALKKCASCPLRQPEDEFPLNPATGRRTTRCKSCAEKNAAQARERRAKKRQSQSGAAADTNGLDPEPEEACDCATKGRACARGEPAPEPIGKDSMNIPTSWNAFRLLLNMRGRAACDINAYVELEDTVDDDGEELDDRILAGNVVRLILEETGYRFNSHTTKPLKHGASFNFFCAQRDGMQTKSQKGQPRSNSSKPRGKERAKLPMERWHCEGWLSVTVVHPDDTPNTSYARVHLRHCLAHKHYVDVSMPDHAKELVHEMQSSTPSKIFRELLRRDPTTVVTQKQVYAYWSTITKNKWQLDDDQVTSAHKLLEHWDGEQVQIIPVPDEDGVSAIAFAFSEMVARLNTGVVEIGLDSTFKTNSAGYELYGILTEVNGQLMPLVTILITTTEAAARNAKERVLEVALRWLHERCPNTRFTLSDKDPSEINACGTVISDGKHQLCYWHSVRYLEERLAQSTPPAAYDAHSAHLKFSFIDPTWAPGVTNGNAEEDFDGRGGVSASNFELHVDDVPIDELETCLPPLYTLTIGEDRIPFWPRPTARKDLPKLPEFCPAEYRPHIVAMFRKHFHLHPSIPLDSQGTRLTAAELHKSAVHQMYTFCWQHDLSQAWAYLWNRWYAPSQWKLWARAACPAIPVLKTTMIVESFWRVVKHCDLADYNRPRLDLLIYTLVTSTLPPLLQRLDEILGERRAGRPSRLASWQQDFKAEWLELSKPDALRNMQKELDVLKKKGRGLRYVQVRADRLAELEADRARPRGDYHVDLDRWTCSCGAYLISRFLLCKHLVRKANTLIDKACFQDNWMWLNLRRRRLPPYYVFPGIHNEPEPDPVYHPKVSKPGEVDLALRTAAASRVTAVRPSSSRSSSPEEQPPVPIDENDNGNVFLASPERRRLREGMDTVYAVLSQPQGVHPRLHQRVQPAVKRLLDFSDSVQSAKRARTSKRTFTDTNKDTLYLD